MTARRTRAVPPPPRAGDPGMTAESEAALLRELAPVEAAAMSMYGEGRYGEAADVLEWLRGRSAGLGLSHPAHLEWGAMLAACRYLSGRYDAARAVYADVAARNRAAGVRSADFAVVLGNYAELCRETGDLAQAESLATEALGIFAATRGRRDADYARVLDRLGRLAVQAGDLPRGETLLRRALRIMRALKDMPPAALSSCLDALAGVHRETGRYRAALRWSDEALSAARTEFGGRHPEVAAALANQAVILAETGEMARAEAPAREAVGIYREVLGSGHPDTANAMNTLGRILRHQGGHDEAEGLLLETLEVYRRMGAPGRFQYRMVLNNLAMIRQVQGRYAEADALCAWIIEAGERDLGPDDPSLATVLNNRAHVAHAAGDFARARPLMERALAILARSRGVGHPDYAGTLAGLARLYEEMGDLRRALALTRRALRVQRKSLGEHHPEVAVTLRALGSFHFARRDYRRAAGYFGQALGIHRANGAGHGLGAARVLESLGVLLMELGDHDQAEAANRGAHRVYTARLGRSHPDVGVSLHNLAVGRHRVGRFAEAAALERRALKVLEPVLGPAHPTVVQLWNSLAFFVAAQGRYSAALRLAVRAEEAFDRTFHSVLAAASERQRIGYLELIRKQHDTFLSLALLPRRGGRGPRAAADLVLRRKGITAEVLAAQRTDARGEHGPMAAELETLAALRLRIARKTLDGPGAEGAAAHRRLLVGWEEELDRREAELAAHVPGLGLEQRLRAAGRHAVAAALPPGSALVELTQYAPVIFDAVPARGETQVGDRRYVALVILPGAPDGARMVDLGPARRIDTLVARFRVVQRRGARELGPERGGGEPRAPDRTGHQLRAAVLDPLLPALRGTARLFVAPDGDLALLPWETLPLADGGCVIDRFHLSYLTTGRDLLRFGAAARAGHGPPVVVAAPDYDLAPSGGAGAEPARAARERKGEARGGAARDLRRAGVWFAPLTWAPEEGRRVARLLNVSPVMGADALEGWVKEIRSPAILHVATHGFFLPEHGRPREARASAAPVAGSPFARLGRVENPLLRSGLALAGANRWLRGLPLPPGAEDGLLTAEDVSALDLHATELVVLSACDTGVGRTRVGEGVFGLRRAFVLAGARTLVTSLWSVPDAETRELMEDFYRRLLAGAPRAEALREAQLAIREKRPDPWYWGGFICQGDPGPLPLALRRSAEEPG